LLIAAPVIGEIATTLARFTPFPFSVTCPVMLPVVAR
jgi:hypothetical protein